LTVFVANTTFVVVAAVGLPIVIHGELETTSVLISPYCVKGETILRFCWPLVDKDKALVKVTVE
jgi:L-lactate permease